MAVTAAIARVFLSNPFLLSKNYFLSFSRYRFSSRFLSTASTNPLSSTCFTANHQLSMDLKPNSLVLGRTATAWRLFSSKSNTNSSATFDWSDDEDDTPTSQNQKTKTKEIDKSRLPPPYDPFSKKPVIEDPKDPKDLQEIFHKMRTEGLIPNAVKMFDALSKDGLTHEALELFSIIKDKGNMPDVVAHTAVIEAYMRMLASGVKPNAYTYTVLIKGLAADGKLEDAKKLVMEMMTKGMKPNAGTYTALFEGFAREEKMAEGKEFLEQMKSKGFVPDEKAVRENLSKRGPIFRSVMNLLFGK
uniref:PROP1-like PPR domain-containing protein n=1 Tax=Nelumbo nucifera TaxID=4432 RepID=A0A822Z4A8_NELNU|nr:TPA_asm: hypothetical protein HUJ06_013696 [Nelumbo nucifera]